MDRFLRATRALDLRVDTDLPLTKALPLTLQDFAFCKGTKKAKAIFSAFAKARLKAKANL